MLVDTFMFYNELDVLEIRLKTLEPYVDVFVLVESEVNHVGGPKELFFEQNKERFAKWLPKIRHVIVTKEESPTDTNPWSREKYQREAILRGIGPDILGHDIVMVSDVDEIPDLSLVRWEHLPHRAMSLHMWMYMYNFEYLFTGEPWYGTVITQIDLFREYGPNYFRDNRWKFPVQKFAGWHLSSFGDEKHVMNKMRTFAHALDENNHKHLQTEENIREWIRTGKHLDGSTDLVQRPPEATIPPVDCTKFLCVF
ncbi:putative glycosyltransferase [Yellowstone lake phycodnavirus 2]|uniref:putative glycosyltransferase n=1 Tax=Yellowstone lake phycodnavirus 2 TaxID=1586714 RepID=UPI0006EB77E3|nr:putative glycosyltransferase [Yellowstone lake phycodnavirus 2]BAT22435.1 putative glycosyltransferase [Yellowstone lake phycodnavirus 2]